MRARDKQRLHSGGGERQEEGKGRTGLHRDETRTDSTKRIPYGPLLPKRTDAIPPSLALWTSYPCLWLTLLTLMLSSATHCGRGQSAHRDPESSPVRPAHGACRRAAGCDPVCAVSWETGASGDFPRRPVVSTLHNHRSQCSFHLWSGSKDPTGKKEEDGEKEAPAWLLSGNTSV